MRFPNLYTWIINNYGIANTNNALLLMLAGVIVCIVVPYLIGSLNPAIILSRKIYHDDIRSHGSGNAGTTNTLRTYGKRMAIVIFSLDLFKAAIAVIAGLAVMGTMGGAVAGIFVIVGHMFPIYYKFKGGKGVACDGQANLAHEVDTQEHKGDADATEDVIDQITHRPCLPSSFSRSWRASCESGRSHRLH